ncbi:MAG: FHA domain-containing protein [Sphingobacteriales bacterium]
MFDLFKKNANKSPQDVKGLRDALLRFIKAELQKAEGGEGGHIKGVNLFITATGNDKHIYQAAVYTEEPDRFKNEIQKIADDYALDLPANWALEVSFDEALPAQALKSEELNAALFIRTKDHVLTKTGAAYITILNGEAEQPQYYLTSDSGKINIGRDAKAQVADGFFRTNHIAFPGNSSNLSNKFISRQHAHIEWNKEDGCFMLYADEGGLPPGNKIKVKTLKDDYLVKLNSTQIGHRLAEGDQIIIGDSAALEFTLQSR